MSEVPVSEITCTAGLGLWVLVLRELCPAEVDEDALFAMVERMREITGTAKTSLHRYLVPLTTEG
ncbi:MAG: hypothetical protein ACRDRX_22905 [Pseudonocardiaceae bacterium]